MEKEMESGGDGDGGSDVQEVSYGCWVIVGCCAGQWCFVCCCYFLLDWNAYDRFYRK